MHVQGRRSNKIEPDPLTALQAFADVGDLFKYGDCLDGLGGPINLKRRFFLFVLLKSQRSSLFRWLLVPIGCVAIQSCGLDQGAGQSGSGDQSEAGQEIAFTTEPGRNQKTLNQGMNAFADYLTKATGVRFRYEPAISYLHAYQLFKAGKIDMIRVGIYGGYKVLKQNPGAKTLAIQKPSYISVLIGNKKLRNKSQPGSADNGLRVIRGERVGFGSLYSGSTLMHPLLDMRRHSVSLTDTEECAHITNQYDLPAMVADGQLDFAFIKGNSVALLGRVKEKDLSRVYVAWQSPEVKRNNYFIVSKRLQDLDQQRLEKDLQKAIIDLTPQDVDQKKVLDGLSKGALGFELPNNEFPGPINQDIDELIAEYGEEPSCET